MDRIFRENRFLLYFLQLIWFSHFIQVLTPETGFDAVWYHLPVVDSIIKNKAIVFSPELYQSLNPLFSDLFFLVGYYFLGTTGAKLIAYFFALSLALTTYKLAMQYLNTKISLAVVTLVSTFQVISWQSSSFYVDAAKAFWEVLAIYFVVKSIDVHKTKNLIFSALAFSASLATKLFSIFLYPVYAIILKISLPKNKKQFWPLSFFLSLTLLFPIHFYINTYLKTGNPFYSFSLHLEKLSEIGGYSNFLSYFLNRTATLIFSPLKLIFVRDYTSPIIPMLIIPVFLKLKNIIKDRKLLILLTFSLFQWLVWWYIPPLSTRYALSGFITLTILGVSVLIKFFPKIKPAQIIFALIFFATINMLPRIWVNIRSLKYILENQTQQEYLEQFYDGSIDEKLKSWYKLG